MNRTHLPPDAAPAKVSARPNAPLLNRRAVLSSLVAMALTPALGVLPSTQSSLAQSCLSAGQTRQAISNGQIVPLARVTAAVRAQGYTEISSANVCQSGGQYVYTVIASTANGASARITVDGASGSILSVQ